MRMKAHSVIRRLSRVLVDTRAIVFAAVAVVLVGAVGLGRSPSPLWLGAIGVGIGGALLIEHPQAGLWCAVLAALVLDLQVGTGTEVVLNPVTLLVPALIGLWAVDALRQRRFTLPRSRANRPLALFLAAGLLSLVLGFVLWDPVVPRSSRFIVVQLAQWAIFAFSAGAFWLAASYLRDETALKRLTFGYLAIATPVAILRVLPQGVSLVRQVATFAADRAPFWFLLVAVGGGQLLFNMGLPPTWQIVTGAGTASALVYALVLERATASNWVGIAAVVGMLLWFRWPRLRWLAILGLVGLLVTGILFSVVYEFAGGDAEWVESGGSRLALIGRVINVTMRNPVTGIGPAAYRPYTKVEPLFYRGAYWVSPNVSSHNNYVDLFSHTGLVGLGLFLWFAVEVILLAVRLRKRYTSGFGAGYVNGMLAAWAGALALMMFADWILPFVYNIGFPGFQASVLVWLFLGGLVALENSERWEDTQDRGS